MSEHSALTQADQDHLDAVAFRRLIDHLSINSEVQNIELMIVADFCRNCLSKWYKTAADESGLDVSLDEARERVYGMPYEDWKRAHQKEATPEQMAQFKARRNG